MLSCNLSLNATGIEQDWRELTGYNRLRNEVGQSLENGAGISVSLVEAGGSNFNFMPDASNAEFAGKVITMVQGLPLALPGTQPAWPKFYSEVLAALQPELQYNGYDAGDWIINRNNLGQAGLNPLANPFSVQNHSYIADGLAGRWPTKPSLEWTTLSTATV